MKPHGLLDKIKIRTKLRLFLFIPIITILVFSISNISMRYQNLKDANNALGFILVSLELADLVHELQKERGLSAGYVGSRRQKFQQLLMEQRNNTDKQIKRFYISLDVNDPKRKFWSLTDKFNALKQGLNSLPEKRTAIDSLTQGDYFDAYSDLNARALNVVEYLQVVNRNAEIARQGGAFTFLLLLQERSGQERGALNGVFSSGKLDAQRFREISAYVADQVSILRNYHTIVSKKYSELLSEQLKDPVIAEVEMLRTAAINKATRNELLNELQELIGYGGLIHLFKDYVIRGDDRYIEHFEKYSITARKIIDRYKILPGISRQDIAFLETVKTTFEQYRAMQKNVMQLRNMGYTITDIDKSIRIDDQPALDAIKSLRKDITNLDTSGWWDKSTRRIELIKVVGDTIRRDVRDSAEQLKAETIQSLAFYLTLTIVSLIVSFGLGRLLMKQLVDEIVAIAAKMRQMQETDSFEGPLNVSGCDEIADMTRAFNSLIEGRKKGEDQRVELEAQLHQSQKMDALGTLAGGIAHDFNNMLAIIIGNVDLLILKITEENRNEMGYLEEILKAADRSGDLIKQILTFSRMTVIQRQPLNVCTAVSEALQMLRVTIPANIDMIQKMPTSCRNILADQTQIHQVVVNLVTNAFHAMEEDGGVLTVTLKELECEACSLLQCSKKLCAACMRLTIEDTGHGMPHDIIENIFDPFFTTKEVGKGTGLGLAVVYSIVQSHQGVITIDSEVNKGTTITICFPLREEKHKGVVAKPADVRPVKDKSGHILLVEDEESLAKLYQKFLEGAGYIVTLCNNGSDALKLFQKDTSQFDLVLTDQAMPNMTGKQLSQELFKIRANIPIILCTGYSNVISKEDAEAIGVRKYLIKPIKLTALKQTIDECLS